MKQAIDCFHEMSQSIKKNCKDSSLLTNLQKSLFTLEPEMIDPQIYSRLMLSIYDLSNHDTLVSTQGIQGHKQWKIVVHSLGIRLKLISMRMICILMQLMMNRNNSVSRLDKEIQIQALQIMILSIRLCLDSQVECLQEIIENQKFCTQIFLYCCPAGEIEVGAVSRNCPIAEEVEMLYYLNKLDLLRLVINKPNFQVLEVENCLKSANRIIQYSFSISHEHKQKYSEYLQNVITQITLKLLRLGNSECFQKFQYYLPGSIKTTLNTFISGELPTINSQANIGEVYQLYWHVCTNGMQSINTESLEKFIGKDEVFEGHEIFEAILLTNEPILLEMWFNESNKKNSKAPNIVEAYQCFIYLLASYINKDKLKQSSLSLRTHQQSQQKQTNYITDLVSLCKQVMLNLFRTNKDSQLPITIVCNFIAKLLLTLVMNLYNYQVCCEIFENFYLVSCRQNFR